MPRRTNEQRVGEAGERLVADTISSHADWLVRTQSHDFGIDLEAELAVSNQDGQILAGKLLKIQVKAREGLVSRLGVINCRLRRDYIAYAAQFRLPVILVVANLQSRQSWYLWLQQWLLENEEKFESHATTKTVAVQIPTTATLESGLAGPLKQIAKGEDEVGIVLALREVAIAATAAGKDELFAAVMEILKNNVVVRRAWVIEKTIDALVGFGPSPWFAETSQMLPQLRTMIREIGELMTAEQAFRLVYRGAAYSRTGVIALSLFFDSHPDHARGLDLGKKFWQAQLDDVAWYCDLRSRYPDLDSIALWGALSSDRPLDLRFGDLELIRTDEVKDLILRKWPNRGDAVFLDCLTVVPERLEKLKKTKGLP